VRKYWDFDPGKRIRYRSDREYEEHFRTVFLESVRRRLRSDCSVLAELSGGMDSSSIVCAADILLARGTAETPRLDTVSYYDDSEPNWNERPYIAKVEEKRGRRGHHINAAAEQTYIFGYESDRLAATPCSNVRPTEAAKHYATCIKSHGNRVVLTGIGGDELMGGVPTPLPELEDLIARAHFKSLAHQLKLWSLNKRRPWIHLLLEAARQFLPIELVRASKHKQPAAWLFPEFVKRNRRALEGYERGVRLFGPLPSFQENITTLEVLRRQLACDVLPSQPPYEKRYPYLDRTLLEFMFAIPREQVVRPGARRSLMRRALTGIVPGEILERKRKAYVVRSSMTSISLQWANLTEQNQNLISSVAGIVDDSSLSSTIEKLQAGHQVPIVTVLRTLGIEAWLRHQASTNLGIKLKHAGAENAGRQPKRFNPFGLNVEQFLGGKNHEV
jgi:asparagine synthase (glutamine-hydrolysing)